MISTYPVRIETLTVEAQQRRAQASWRLWFLFVCGIATVLSYMGLRGSMTPSLIGWCVYLFGVAIILHQPRYGVYLLVGLTLAGDRSLTDWYPFAKNFSSSESLLYLSQSVNFNPAESYMVLTFFSWLGRGAVQRKIEWNTGPLFWPVMIFIGFVTYGLIYGLRLQHGDQTIGLWESRSMYYIPFMLFLVSNLITRREHVNTLIWWAMIALFIDALSGVWFVATALNFDLSLVDRIQEHSGSIHLNSLFILLAASSMYRGARSKRLAIQLMLPVLLISYLANQRRAAFLTLMIALAVIAAILFWENRKAFWLIIPPLSVIGVLYLAAFWGVDHPLAMPASAVRSIIDEQQGTADYASNLYRRVENVNIKYTIQHAPLTGIGFGKKFYIIWRMPRIDFEWWEYIPHNSILWFWIKTGIGGFLALLYMIGSALIMGMRTLLRMPRGEMSSIALFALLYVFMHFTFAYVDISWDSQSMVYVGMMMGLINSLQRIVSNQVEPAPRRWPWQPEPQPLPGLRSR